LLQHAAPIFYIGFLPSNRSLAIIDQCGIIDEYRTCTCTLVDKLQRYIGRRDTRFRDAINTPRRVLIFLSFVGRGIFYVVLADMFGRGVSTVACIVRDVADAIIEVFLVQEHDMASINQWDVLLLTQKMRPHHRL
jgi:hypothetical protein